MYVCKLRLDKKVIKINFFSVTAATYKQNNLIVLNYVLCNLIWNDELNKNLRLDFAYNHFFSINELNNKNAQKVKFSQTIFGIFF